MRQIDKETKEKRSKVYYSKARIKPTYIFLVVPIFVGLAMGIDEFLETKMWGKALVYVLSLGTISSALFFLLRLVLRDISLVYPGKILFCNRLKPTIAMLYADDNEFTEENKTAIRKKIKCKKGIDLQPIKNKTYKNNKYAKRVDEAVNWLLDVTRFDDILFDYNCNISGWYCFIYSCCYQHLGHATTTWTFFLVGRNHLCYSLIYYHMVCIYKW